MGFRIALALSILLHILVLGFLYLLPKPEEKLPEAYEVRMVSPEEFLRGQRYDEPSPQRPPTPSRPSYEAEPPPTEILPTEAPEKTAPRPEKEPSPPPGPGETGAPPSVTGPETPGEVPPPGQPAPGTPLKPGPSPLPPSDVRPGQPGPSGIPRPGDIRDIIDKIAKAPAPAEDGSDGITFSTKDLRVRSYMERLKDKIEGTWEYPREAAEKGIFGDLYIRFEIKKDGSLGDVKVTRTSGYTELDEAAVQALREGAPFWPLPDGWPERSLTINGHFIYTLWGSYVR